MQWRRGLLLAGIHVVVAAAMFVQVESAAWPMIKANTERNTALRPPAPPEEGTVAFYPCDGTWLLLTPPEEKIVGFANLPVALLTGWHQPCTSYSGLTAIVESQLGTSTCASEITISIILCVLVFIQWFMVGGFPIVRPRRWWLEPATLITICTLVSIFLVVVPVIREFSIAPMAVALLAWLYWFVMWVWNTFRFGWRRWFVRAEAN
jgi:hypothetical protein